MAANNLTGLIPAPHTPFDADGRLCCEVVPRQVEHFVRLGVRGAFVGGTTGEALSLSLTERLRLAETWIDAARDAPLGVILQVGGNCMEECRELAGKAQQWGADAIAALAPCFFRPSDVATLIDYCEAIAAEAPDTPFYYYDIPQMTGVRLPMADWLTQALPRIPTLRGLKYSNDDLTQLQQCLAVAPDRLQVLFGYDQFLLSALVLGVHGAVGSTYNFAAPLYQRMMTALENGDLQTARQCQYRSVQLIRCLERFGFPAAAKAAMRLIGIDCGPVRSPLRPLTESEFQELTIELRKIGFFELTA